MAFSKTASLKEAVKGKRIPNEKENVVDDADHSEQDFLPLDSIVASSESSQCSSTSWSSNSSDIDLDDEETNSASSSFLIFRLSYIFVNLVIMLADGLQGKTNNRSNLSTATTRDVIFCSVSYQFVI